MEENKIFKLLNDFNEIEKILQENKSLKSELKEKQNLIEEIKVKDSFKLNIEYLEIQQKELLKKNEALEKELSENKKITDNKKKHYILINENKDLTDKLKDSNYQKDKLANEKNEIEKSFKNEKIKNLLKEEDLQAKIKKLEETNTVLNNDNNIFIEKLKFYSSEINLNKKLEEVNKKLSWYKTNNLRLSSKVSSLKEDLNKINISNNEFTFSEDEKELLLKENNKLKKTVRVLKEWNISYEKQLKNLNN